MGEGALELGFFEGGGGPEIGLVEGGVPAELGMVKTGLGCGGLREDAVAGAAGLFGGGDGAGCCGPRLVVLGVLGQELGDLVAAAA